MSGHAQAGAGRGPSAPRVVAFRRVAGAPEAMSDAALVAACAVGDRAALGAFFDRHFEGVRRFLGRLSGTDERDLDDLVQSTFVAVPMAARGYDGRSTVRSWLYGIALNMARHHIRAEMRRKRNVEAFAAQPASALGDVTEEVLARERTARLGAAIHDLPDDLREAFVLVYLEGLTGAEAATALGIREGTLWKRLHLARARLHDALAGETP